MADLLTPCPSCGRHIRTTEDTCPFCGSAQEHPCTPEGCPRKSGRGRLVNRAAIAGLGTMTGLAACSGGPVYGAPGGEWHEPTTGGESNASPPTGGDSNPDAMTTGGRPLSEDGGAGGVAAEGGAGGEESR